MGITDVGIIFRNYGRRVRDAAPDAGMKQWKFGQNRPENTAEKLPKQG